MSYRQMLGNSTSTTNFIWSFKMTKFNFLIVLALVPFLFNGLLLPVLTMAAVLFVGVYIVYALYDTARSTDND